MGTRGSYGFLIESESKLTYNHFDSYPAGLGSTIVDGLKNIIKQPKDVLIEKVRNIRLVDETFTPTEEDITNFNGFSDISVRTGKLDNWYTLLREMCGNIEAHLEEGIMINNNTFITDSLFCEWAYIINLDTWKFEIWKGFQKEYIKNRYQLEEADRGYWACAMVIDFDLNSIPDNWENLVNLICCRRDFIDAVANNNEKISHIIIEECVDIIKATLSCLDFLSNVDEETLNKIIKAASKKEMIKNEYIYQISDILDRAKDKFNITYEL